MKVTLDDVVAAHARIERHIHRTPVFTSRWLDGLTGAEVFLKAENLQKVGAFKARGACNAVLSLSPEDAERGVLTHSSGNHAQALALAARIREVPAWVVMPENAPPVKVAAVEGYGATVVRCASTLAAREETAARIEVATGAAFVHPYDDARVIAGQGTAARELLQDAGPLDLLLVPVGGGGLLAGTAVAAMEPAEPPDVIGVEPEAADDAARSFREGRLIPQTDPRTIADGLRTSLGRLNLGIIRAHVHDIVTVSETAIADATRSTMERLKLVVAPSAAVPVAALLSRRLDVRGRRVGIILSGGNLNLDLLPWS